MLVDRQNLVLWSDMALMSKANIAAKAGKGAAPAGPGMNPDGTPADLAATPPGQDEPRPDGVPPADGQADDGKPPAESVLRRGQQAIYRKRLALALKLMPRISETSDLATAVRAQLAENYPSEATAWVDDAEWSGPHPVPVDDVDTSNRARHHRPAPQARQGTGPG